MQNSIDQISTLFNSLDWIIFFVVILITVASVLYGNRLKQSCGEKENILDILIMGRQLTLPLFVATLVATWYGGIFGVTKIAFNNGIYNFVTQGFFWYITYIIFALFLVQRISTYKAITLPDLIGKMFGRKSEKLAAIFNFFNVLPIAYTISIGLLIEMLFNFDLTLSMILGVTFVVLYSLWGGLRAVVFSDLIQFFVMCLGVFFVIIFSMNQYGGINFLKENLPSSYFSPTGNNSLATTFVWGFIALSTLVDPNFYQRVFAAKSSKVARNGILISTFIWIGFDLCTTFGAMYAKAVIPEADSEQAYFIYAIQLLPNGFRGFFIAGILATILSTLDSYLFLAGTTIGYDLMPKNLKGKVSTHHLGVGIVAVLSIIMAIVFEGNIKQVWKTLGSYSAGCFLFPVLLGHLFKNKISDGQFVCGCLFGVFFITTWRIIPLSGFLLNIDDLYMGVAGSVLGIVVFPLLKRLAK